MNSMNLKEKKDLNSVNLCSKLLTVREAADLLGISMESVRDFLNDPTLGRIFVGSSNQVRIPTKSLIDYIDERASNWPQYTTGL